MSPCLIVKLLRKSLPIPISFETMKINFQFLTTMVGNFYETSVIKPYYMATIVRALWLGAESARFSCNDRTLCKFSRLDRSFWVVSKASTRAWAKTTKNMDKYNYIFNSWKKNKHTVDSLVRATKRAIVKASRMTSCAPKQIWKITSGVFILNLSKNIAKGAI